MSKTAWRFIKMMVFWKKNGQLSPVLSSVYLGGVEINSVNKYFLPNAGNS